MHKASKQNPTYSQPRAKRQTCVWFRPDLGGLTCKQWWDERMRVDYSPMGEKSNKTYGKCKHKSRFPDCTSRIRQYQLPDGEIVSEQTGQCNHIGTMKCTSVVYLNVTKMSLMNYCS